MAGAARTHASQGRMMSANSGREIDAVMAVEKDRLARKKAEAERQKIELQIGSLVAKQFHAMLIRAVSGLPVDGLAEIDNGDDSGERIDALITDAERRLIPEVRLFICIIANTAHDYIGVIAGKSGDKPASIRADAERYFTSKSRRCLDRHCMLVGLDPAFVRRMVQQAVEFVAKYTDKAFAEQRQRSTAPIGRGQRLMWLVKEVEAEHAA